MDASNATIEVSANGAAAINVDQLAWAEDRLGPMAGKWDGYNQIPDEETRRQVYTDVGFIHGQSAEAGRSIVAIGEKLCRIKEALPHGQFMACVKDEFGWDRAWTGQLMKVAKRFSNVHSTIHLPSSAMVLALLASHAADDATVQQAAEENWSVATTKQKLRKPSGPRQPQPAEELALSLIRKGELERIREALALAERAQVVRPQQVMDEQRLRDLGKQRFIAGSEADFHRMKDGSWIRMPHSGRIDVPVSPEPEPKPVLTVFAEGASEPASTIDLNIGLMPLERAAEIIGMAKTSLQQRLVPSVIEKYGRLTRNGYMVTKEGRGKVRLSRT